MQIVMGSLSISDMLVVEYNLGANKQAIAKYDKYPTANSMIREQTTTHSRIHIQSL